MNLGDLAHIDPVPSAAERNAVNLLLRAELDPQAGSVMHPNMTHSKQDPQFSSAIQEMHRNIEETGKPRPNGEGIDTTRYDDLAAPEHANDPEAWRSSLRQAYIAQEYLTARDENLNALDDFGKRAWLLANFQLENELRPLESELKNGRAQVQEETEHHRQAQVSYKSEVDALNGSWREVLGRTIEAEVTTEHMRQKARVLLKSNPNHRS